jgi:hypothetical protein
LAGIINIIYKKETRKGLTGDIGFTYGLGMLTIRRDDVPSLLGSYSLNPKYIPSLNLDYRKGRVNIFFQSEVFNQRRLQFIPCDTFARSLFANTFDVFGVLIV